MDNIFGLVPPDRHEDGGKWRINVKHESGNQPILLTRDELDRLRMHAHREGTSMSEVVRQAVRDLAARLDPNGHADIPRMAAKLGVPASALVGIKNDPAMRFAGDLSFLARMAGGVSLSRAARWAVNVYLDGTKGE